MESDFLITGMNKDIHFDRILLWSDFKVQKMQYFEPKNITESILPHKNTIDKLISEARVFDSQYIGNLFEFVELK